MKTPPGLTAILRSWLVSLTLLAFAALMLLLPLYRLAVVHWPEPIVEHVYPDGTVGLHESVPAIGDDGVERSRPLTAARVQFSDGRRVLGYVVSVRNQRGEIEQPPSGTAWQPAMRECELALARPGSQLAWESCSEIVEVSKPNRMRLITRARLAAARAFPGLLSR